MKPGGDVARIPKQGYQWYYKKDLCPSKTCKRICQQVVYEKHCPAWVVDRRDPMTGDDVILL